MYKGVLIHLQHSNQRWFSHYMRFIGIYESFSLNSSISCILGARFIRNMDPLLYVSCFHSQSKRIKFGDNFLMHVAYRGGMGAKCLGRRKVPTMSQVLSSVQYICFRKTLGSNLGALNLFLSRPPSDPFVPLYRTPRFSYIRLLPLASDVQKFFFCMLSNF